MTGRLPRNIQVASRLPQLNGTINTRILGVRTFYGVPLHLHQVPAVCRLNDIIGLFQTLLPHTAVEIQLAFVFSYTVGDEPFVLTTIAYLVPLKTVVSCCTFHKELIPMFAIRCKKYIAHSSMARPKRAFVVWDATTEWVHTFVWMLPNSCQSFPLDHCSSPEHSK